jgi:hypothetical protein
MLLSSFTPYIKFLENINVDFNLTDQLSNTQHSQILTKKRGKIWQYITYL